MTSYDFCLSLSDWLSMIIFRSLCVAANGIILLFTMNILYTIKSPKRSFTQFWFLKAELLVLVLLRAGFLKLWAGMPSKFSRDAQEPREWIKGRTEQNCGCCSCRWYTGRKTSASALEDRLFRIIQCQSLLWPLWVTLISQLKKHVKQTYVLLRWHVLEVLLMGLLISPVWWLKLPPSQPIVRTTIMHILEM